MAWNYRKEIPFEFLLTKNSETSIYYSNAQLTVVDLVHEQHIGGLSRAATILEELSELIHFSDTSDSLFSYTSLAVIQRLGFILDVVLQEGKQHSNMYFSVRVMVRVFGRKIRAGK